jgi:hypothetical protein
MAIKATMVNVHLKSGIQNDLAKIMNLHRGTVSRQWTSSSFKLVKLLGNQDEELGEPIVTIIQRHAHFCLMMTCPPERKDSTSMIGS